MKELKDLFKNKKFVIGICLGLVIVSLLIILLLSLTNNKSENDNINTTTTKPTTSTTTTATNMAENDNELENENIDNNNLNITNSTTKKTTTKKVQSSTNKTTEKQTQKPNNNISTSQSNSNSNNNNNNTNSNSNNSTNNTIKPTTPEVITYMVTFNENDGTPFVNKIINKDSELGTLPSIKMKDYEFLGWYLNGNKVNENTKVTSDFTLNPEFKYLNSERQLHDGYPRPDMAYSYSTAESGQRYLDLLNALWDDEMVPRLNKGFYSQEEIDDYLEWIDNKAYEFREVLECKPGYEYMCE